MGVGVEPQGLEHGVNVIVIVIVIFGDVLDGLFGGLRSGTDRPTDANRETGGAQGSSEIERCVQSLEVSGLRQ